MEEEKSEKDRKIAELTEEKERLTEKLEDERKTSENRANLLQREIDRIRTGDERRFLFLNLFCLIQFFLLRTICFEIKRDPETRFETKCSQFGGNGWNVLIKIRDRKHAFL